MKGVPVVPIFNESVPLWEYHRDNGEGHECSHFCFPSATQVRCTTQGGATIIITRLESDSEAAQWLGCRRKRANKQCSESHPLSDHNRRLQPCCMLCMMWLDDTLVFEAVV